MADDVKSVLLDLSCTKGDKIAKDIYIGKYDRSNGQRFTRSCFLVEYDGLEYEKYQDYIEFVHRNSELNLRGIPSAVYLATSGGKTRFYLSTAWLLLKQYLDTLNLREDGGDYVRYSDNGGKYLGAKIQRFLSDVLDGLCTSHDNGFVSGSLANQDLNNTGIFVSQVTGNAVIICLRSFLKIQSSYRSVGRIPWATTVPYVKLRSVAKDLSDFAVLVKNVLAPLVRHLPPPQVNAIIELFDIFYREFKQLNVHQIEALPALLKKSHLFWSETNYYDYCVILHRINRDYGFLAVRIEGKIQCLSSKSLLTDWSSRAKRDAIRRKILNSVDGKFLPDYEGQLRSISSFFYRGATHLRNTLAHMDAFEAFKFLYTAEYSGSLPALYNALAYVVLEEVAYGEPSVLMQIIEDYFASKKIGN